MGRLSQFDSTFAPPSSTLATITVVARLLRAVSNLYPTMYVCAYGPKTSADVSAVGIDQRTSVQEKLIVQCA